jgi:phage gpG-like protein
VPYAAYHQRGGWVTGWPPQRKVIDLPESARREILRIVQRHLVMADRAVNGVPVWAPPTGHMGPEPS